MKSRSPKHTTPAEAREWLSNPSNFWDNDELCYVCGTEYDSLAVESGGKIFCRMSCCTSYLKLVRKAELA